jgi:hypothetical protein
MSDAAAESRSTGRGGRARRDSLVNASPFERIAPDRRTAGAYGLAPTAAGMTELSPDPLNRELVSRDPARVPCGLRALLRQLAISHTRRAVERRA